jgi:nitrogen-specific signal transduction histidine kinase
MVSYCNSVVAVKQEHRSKAAAPNAVASAASVSTKTMPSKSVGTKAIDSRAVAAVQSTPERDLAGALHEVSNALTVVLGWLDNARAGVEGPALEAIEVARSHASLGHAIARRAVGAPLGDASELRSAVTLVRDTVRGISPIAERRGVQVQVDDEVSDVLLPDPSFVQQILINLLLNAIAFTPHGETIRLTLRNERNNRFLFRVRDEGPGIPAEQRAGIFSVGPSGRPGGAGIGLAHSHDLAASRGGSLALLDGGAGACFELRWPVGDAPSTTLSRSLSPRALVGLRVAVLEDDPAVMSLLEFGLTSRGVELFALANRKDLDAFAKSGTCVDAALIDLSPIAADPDGAIVALRRNSPQVSVFLISGTAISAGTNQAVSGWIRKPFELGEIFQALGRAQRA